MDRTGDRKLASLHRRCAAISTQFDLNHQAGANNFRGFNRIYGGLCPGNTRRFGERGAKRTDGMAILAETITPLQA